MRSMNPSVSQVNTFPILMILMVPTLSMKMMKYIMKQKFIPIHTMKKKKFTTMNFILTRTTFCSHIHLKRKLLLLLEPGWTMFSSLEKVYLVNMGSLRS